MNERNSLVPHNTEDRPWWYIHGENLERQFVSLGRDKFELDAHINPRKSIDKTAPDLVVNGLLADLKTQNTPFFTSRRYDVDPQFAVTFNRKDYERYKKLYPDLIIYFWINWQQLTWRDMHVAYYGGIFSLPFSEVEKLIGSAPEHFYQNRMDPSDRNAKSSFVLDIRKFDVIKIFDAS